MGWYAMALVEVLDHLPREHAARSSVIAILKRVVDAVAKVQDQSTGLWYQVLDQGTRPGNYLEASASCMFVHAIAKAVRKAYVPIEQLAIAQRGYRGIIAQLLSIDDRGSVNLNGVCSVAGLGGDPYRDGSYEYYIKEPVVANDLKGVGSFILAAVEMEDAQRSQRIA
jgi:unsaturated rhamnogalacturonyl hydrolase